MLHIKPKKELAQDAFTLATNLELVRYRSTTYIPADYETLETSVPPLPQRKIWLPLNRRRIQRLAAAQFNIMFGSDSDLASFDFMLAQAAAPCEKQMQSLLVKTPDGLRELNPFGKLVEVDGTFRANYILPTLNDDVEMQQKIFGVVSEWLNSDEEAEALLRHLATSLAPGWSAVKSILLIGKGRNGKSVLMKMLQGLFGQENVSNITRQQMAEQKVELLDLNEKLLNIVYDGRAEYLKDSGTEKSLIAGEPVAIRKLYESTSTIVQTNALFIEGLNREPKTQDKSSALQRRLVRFQFENEYPLKLEFEKEMLSPDHLGAFLALLIDRYVVEEKVAELLAPTAKAKELELEHLFANSLGLQYLKHVEETDTFGAMGLLDQPFKLVLDGFRSWRVRENDLSTWSEPDLQALFKPYINTERRSKRDGKRTYKIYKVVSFTAEATAFLESLKGADTDAALIDALVDD